MSTLAATLDPEAVDPYADLDWDACDFNDQLRSRPAGKPERVLYDRGCQ